MMLRVISMLQKGHSLRRIANDTGSTVPYIKRILKDIEKGGGVSAGKSPVQRLRGNGLLQQICGRASRRR